MIIKIKHNLIQAEIKLEIKLKKQIMIKIKELIHLFILIQI